MNNRQLRIKDLRLNEDYDNVFYRGVNLRENKRREVPDTKWTFEKEKERYNEGYRVSSVKMDDPKTTKFLEGLNFKSRYIGGFQEEEEESPRREEFFRERKSTRLDGPIRESYSLVKYNKDKHVYESQFKPLTEKAREVWNKIIDNNSLKEFDEFLEKKFKENALSERGLNRYLENNSEEITEKFNLKSFKEKRVKPLNEEKEIIRRKTPDDPWGLLGGDRLNKKTPIPRKDSLNESERVHDIESTRELYPEDPWNLLSKSDKDDMGLKEARDDREDTRRRVDLDDPWGLYKRGIISRDSIE